MARKHREDAFSALRLVVMGQQLAAMMQNPVVDLPWPANLFSQQKAMMAQPMQHQRRSDAEALCICGKEHHQNLPWTRRSPYGSGFTVQYLCSARCKDRAVQEFYK